MKTENLIGKELAVNEGKISAAERALNSILPHIRSIIDEYNRVIVDPQFSQKIWKQIQLDNGKSIADDYRSKAKGELSVFKNDAIRDSLYGNAEDAISRFLNAIDAAKKELDQRRFSLTGGVLDIQLSDIQIRDGGPVVDLSHIREQCTLRIRTPAQAELYQAGLDAEKALDRLRILLKDTISDPYKIGWGEDGRAGVFEYDIPTAKMTFNIFCIEDAKE